MSYRGKLKAFVAVAFRLFILASFFCASVNAQDSQVTYYMTDGQNNVLGTMDKLGNVTQITDYRPYGSPAGSTQPINGPGYSGHVSDLESQLIYMQARYYDPQVGRFLSTDPVSPTPGDMFLTNRYAYVNNNPIKNTDPSGKCIWDACVVETYVVAIAIAGVAAYTSKIILDNIRDHPVVVSNESSPNNDSSSPVVASDGSTLSDRQPGNDGKVGSTGGPGAGKVFAPETPETRAAKEGVPCVYCGQATTNEKGHPNSRERDHIDAKKNGGNNTPPNERDSCRTCNRSKGSKSIEEWKPKESNT